MTPFAIAEARVRGILDSRARITVEADVRLRGGQTGRGSVPVAIAPGARERPRSARLELGAGAGSAAAKQVTRELEDQRFGALADLDGALEELVREAGAGADVGLAISLAAWRATAELDGRPLHRHLAEEAGTSPALPHPLVNVFSGGIHADAEARGFQQVMAVPELGSAREDIEAALAVFAAVERRLRASARPHELSASSGLLVEASSQTQLVAELRDEVARHDATGRIGVGVDVAAEHLATGDGSYRLGDRVLSGEEMLEMVAELAAANDLTFLEDPFAPGDEHLWRALIARLPEGSCLVGDDLFATDAARVDPGLAHGILLKPSQAGTVTATLRAAAAARAAGMTLCVSHRSGETEDTFVCDLAVAVGARFQKVGGPRRGDRIAKYNQLLRLAEDPALAPADGTGREQTQLTTLEVR